MRDAPYLEQIPDTLPLSALILHVSRCGSTLITRMLTTLPQCVALSEPSKRCDTPGGRLGYALLGACPQRLAEHGIVRCTTGRRSAWYGFIYLGGLSVVKGMAGQDKYRGFSRLYGLQHYKSFYPAAGRPVRISHCLQECSLPARSLPESRRSSTASRPP